MSAPRFSSGALVEIISPAARCYVGKRFILKGAAVWIPPLRDWYWESLIRNPGKIYKGDEPSFLSVGEDCLRRVDGDSRRIVTWSACGWRPKSISGEILTPEEARRRL